MLETSLTGQLIALVLYNQTRNHQENIYAKSTKGDLNRMSIIFTYFYCMSIPCMSVLTPAFSVLYLQRDFTQLTIAYSTKDTCCLF